MTCLVQAEHRSWEMSSLYTAQGSFLINRQLVRQHGDIRIQKRSSSSHSHDSTCFGAADLNFDSVQKPKIRSDKRFVGVGRGELKHLYTMEGVHEMVIIRKQIALL